MRHVLLDLVRGTAVTPVVCFIVVYGLALGLAFHRVVETGGTTRRMHEIHGEGDDEGGGDIGSVGLGWDGSVGAGYAVGGVEEENDGGVDEYSVAGEECADESHECCLFWEDG